VYQENGDFTKEEIDAWQKPGALDRTFTGDDHDVSRVNRLGF